MKTNDLWVIPRFFFFCLFQKTPFADALNDLFIQTLRGYFASNILTGLLLLGEPDHKNRVISGRVVCLFAFESVFFEVL